MKKIYIADDDTAILEALQMMLEFEGYEVTVTDDGSTLMELKENLPDLILLDVWLSGQDGRDISRYLKSSPHTNHIPIIMISASKDMEHSAREALADDFIAKPFDIDEVVHKVKTKLT